MFGAEGLSWGFSGAGVRGVSGVGVAFVCRAWWCPLPSIR